MAVEQQNTLFKDHVFGIVTSQDLNGKLAAQFRATLEENGAAVVDLQHKTSLEPITHIISKTSDFPQYSDTRFYMIPVVNPDWIKQSLLKGKEAPYRPYTPDPNLIFSDVTISCADIPTGDKDAIIGGVLAMGGMETSNITKLTTHICALTIDHPKCQTVLNNRIKCKIVLPHWFDDCLKLGKRIDERPYLLPDPEIFRTKPEADLAIAVSENVRGASSPNPAAFPLPTETPGRRLDVFTGKKIMISDDFSLSNRTRKVIEDVLEQGGASMTTSVYNASIYICQYREGRDYQIASRYNIDVGNLAWLYFMIVNNEWTSPLRRLLHYPLPKDGFPEFQNYKISLSNYGGEARTYLENLITATGGTFTKSMKQDNTHLITARKSSEKCDAAAEWGVEMVNHLWLEESYAKCQAQRLTDPRYTHFPPRTNLGEVIGRTQFEKEILETLYFATTPSASPNSIRSLKRKAMHEKDQNTPVRISECDAEMTGRDESTPVSKRKQAGRRKSVLSSISTPTGRRVSFGKENNSPSTGSRSAKDKAAARIHDLTPDIQLYEKEKKRKGLVWGGERAANQLDKQKTLDRSKSPANRAEEAEEKEDEEEEVEEDKKSKPAKRQRSSLPQTEMNILITGYKRWINNPQKEDTDKRKLREMGIRITQDAKNCTHLAAPSIVRTKKFLCALANGPTVLSTDFLDICLQKGSLQDEDDFLLKDPESEKKFRVRLKDAIARAKANQRSLLRNVPIYCTQAIPNGTDTYQAIVAANGGHCLLYTGRPVVREIKDPENDPDAGEPIYLLTGQKPEERKLWASFEEMAKSGNMEPRVVDTEWLLDVVLLQKSQWNKDLYLAKNHKE